MLLVASAARSDVKRWDLSTPEQLEFRVWSRSENEPSSQLIADIDLQQHLQADLAAGNEQRVASTLSNGQQSMIIGGVFTTEAGWRLALDCSCHGGDNWGALVPALKEALCRWPQLVASQHCQVDPAEKVRSGCSTSSGQPGAAVRPAWVASCHEACSCCLRKRQAVSLRKQYHAPAGSDLALYSDQTAWARPRRPQACASANEGCTPAAGGPPPAPHTARCPSHSPLPPAGGAHPTAGGPHTAAGGATRARGLCRGGCAACCRPRRCLCWRQGSHRRGVVSVGEGRGGGGQPAGVHAGRWVGLLGACWLLLGAAHGILGMQLLALCHGAMQAAHAKAAPAVRLSRTVAKC
jgi:hypothetical protein